MRHPALASAAAWGLLLAGGAGAAERPWFEIKTPGFTVVSNASEGDARDVAWQFEQVRSALPAVWPWAQRDEAREFVVFVARDEASLRAFAPQWFARDKGEMSDAVYVSGSDADYVGMRLDVTRRADPRVNLYLTAFRGYADNVIVRHLRLSPPPWLRDGLGSMLGNTLVREKDLEIGRAIPWYVEELTGRATGTSEAARSAEEARAEDRRTQAPGTAALLPLERLVAVKREDPEFTGDTARRLFNAQSWAFVHYLMFGDGGVHRAKFNRMLAALREGVPADEAVRQLGDLAAYTKGFRAHVGARTIPFQRAPIDVDVAKEKWPVRPLPPAQEAAVRARFAVAMDERTLAREKIAAARAASPELPGAYEAEGLLLSREGDRTAAVAALRKARELGSTSGWVADWIDGRPRTTPAATAGTAPRAAAAAAPANIDHLVVACNKGDDEACRRMAEALTLACEGGDTPSCMPLGWLYTKGRGVDLDIIQGELLYERACNGGEPKACLALARSIEDRSEAPDDRARAAELTAVACARGLTAACAAAKKK